MKSQDPFLQLISSGADSEIHLRIPIFIRFNADRRIDLPEWPWIECLKGTFEPSVASASTAMYTNMEEISNLGRSLRPEHPHFPFRLPARSEHFYLNSPTTADSLADASSPSPAHLCSSWHLTTLWARATPFFDTRHFSHVQSMIPAPIQKLPVEVLDHIFAFYCFSQDDGYTLSWWDDTVRVFVSCPPLGLSQVCAFWRTYVPSRPLLWSSWKLSSRAFRLQPGTFQLFLKYLENSGNHPLDFYYVEVDDFWPSKKAEAALDALLDNSVRWRRATLLASEYSAQGFFMRAAARLTLLEPSRSPSGHFPALEYLEIPPYLPWSEGLLDFLPTLQFSPRLKSYYGSSFSWSGHSVNFSQITELSLTSFTGKSIGHLLQPLPTLQSLALGSFQLAEDDEDDTLIQGARYHYSNLSELIVSTRTFYPTAWRFLRLPKLTDLRILGTPAVQFDNYVHLSSMLVDSQCDLQNLKLQFFVPIRQQMLNFIASFPSIVNLTVAFWNFDDINILVEGLVRNEDDGFCLVPDLGSLTLIGRQRVRVRDGLIRVLASRICEMVKSRCDVAMVGTSPVPAAAVVGNTIGSSRAFGFGLRKLCLNLDLDVASQQFLSDFIRTELDLFIESGLEVDTALAV
ncbi:hypothetical protein D9757_015270 [Collybiopsis confluens]|uniref:F-box domain-containing protein n=1 Tax=Collybiopsis confluens TaxID=2823264 RepID=A0A8H5CJ76_9AGAR|nr:hypothetical protein D9757_015270 [Collybiopsis confluens]